MAQDTSLEGLRSQMIHSFYGRRDGIDANDFTVGPKDVRLQVSGLSSAGSTIVSTSVASKLPNWGISLLGATLASATTGYVLDNPVPGVSKTLFLPTTGAANIATSTAAGAGAFICSTASVGSTHQNIAMAGKGANLVLWALTTALWAAMVAPASSASTNITFS